MPIRTWAELTASGLQTRVGTAKIETPYAVVGRTSDDRLWRQPYEVKFLDLPDEDDEVLYAVRYPGEDWSEPRIMPAVACGLAPSSDHDWEAVCVGYDDLASCQLLLSSWSELLSSNFPATPHNLVAGRPYVRISQGRHGQLVNPMMKAMWLYGDLPGSAGTPQFVWALKAGTRNGPLPVRMSIESLGLLSPGQHGVPPTTLWVLRDDLYHLYTVRVNVAAAE